MTQQHPEATSTMAPASLSEYDGQLSSVIQEGKSCSAHAVPMFQLLPIISTCHPCVLGRQRNRITKASKTRVTRKRPRNDVWQHRKVDRSCDILSIPAQAMMAMERVVEFALDNLEIRIVSTMMLRPAPMKDTECSKLREFN